MAKWFKARYNKEVRFSSAVKYKKGPQVLTSLLNLGRNYYNYLKRYNLHTNNFTIDSNEDYLFVISMGIYHELSEYPYC